MVDWDPVEQLLAAEIAKLEAEIEWFLSSCSLVQRPFIETIQHRLDALKARACGVSRT